MKLPLNKKIATGLCSLLLSSFAYAKDAPVKNPLRAALPASQDEVYAEEIVEDVADSSQSAAELLDEKDLQEGQEPDTTPEEAVADKMAEDTIDEQLVDKTLSEVPENMTFTLVHNDRVENFIKMYVGRKRSVFEVGLSRYGKYIPAIKNIFRQYGLPQELAYLSIVESNLNPRAVSKANAVGIWQFMRYTGKLYGLKSDLYYDERLNVEKASHAAAQHLRDLFFTFHSWELALAAYNSGAGNVRKAIKRNIRLKKPIDFWALRLPRETRGYVPAFHAVAHVLANPRKYGFDFNPANLERIEKIPTKAIQVPPTVSFAQIENKLEIDRDLLSELNPEIRHNITPPGAKYSLLVPATFSLEEDALKSLKSEPLNILITHRVRKGETLSTIARRYGIRLTKLYDLNPHVRAKRLSVGARLIVQVTNGNQNRVVQR